MENTQPGAVTVTDARGALSVTIDASGDASVELAWNAKDAVDAIDFAVSLQLLINDALAAHRLAVLRSAASAPPVVVDGELAVTPTVAERLEALEERVDTARKRISELRASEPVPRVAGAYASVRMEELGGTIAVLAVAETFYASAPVAALAEQVNGCLLELQPARHAPSIQV